MSDLHPSVDKCPSCGAPVAEGASVCTYCQSPLAWGGKPPLHPNRSVRDAATEWARKTFGAPGGFADLIQSVQVHDEVFHRIFTTSARRDVTEERVAANERRSQAARVDPNTVDPFALSTEALRAKSEHVTSCTSCGGSGSASCPGCGGDGRTNCPHCGGSGQERRYYQKSSRLVKCGVCRAAGTVACGMCDGSGNVTCRGCNGSGHQVAWLTYGERSRGYVSITPESPVYVAHGQLLEPRALEPADLQAFGTLISQEDPGPLHLSDGMDKAFLRVQTSSLDPRLERVTYQQYLKLAIVRRDATFEMSGTRGVLILSGSNLDGSLTEDSTRPIRRRLYLWTLLGCALLAGMMTLFGWLHGSAPYFDRSNGWLLGACLATALLGSIFIGGFLRVLRPGFRLGNLHRFETWIGACAVASLVVALLVFMFSRPTAGEVQHALAMGNTAGARMTLVALHSTKGDTSEVLAADDAVTVAEARALTGDDKLQVLDKVAARKGPGAKDAADMARTERLAEMRQLLVDHRSADAVARIDRWWPSSWQGDPEVADVRARAEDQLFAGCSDAPCRYSAAALAQGAVATPDREARTSAARQTLVSELSFSEVTGERTLSRLQRLRALAATAAKSAQISLDDRDMTTKAAALAMWANNERGKVPLIAAGEAVADELLGSVSHRDVNVDSATVDGVLAFLSMDGQKTCRGVYLVGPTRDSRTLDAAPETTSRLLSQAVGHPAAIKNPVRGASTSRWVEGGTMVVGRWTNGALVELRIGDATP
jgi:hypothetical protein